MNWTKVGTDGWICKVQPDDRFTLKAQAKADGRWTWQVFAGTSDKAMASGTVNTIGDAKHAMESFMKGKYFI